MTLPVYRASLPQADRLLPYLRRLDTNRWYSNRGELVSQLEERLGALLGVGRAQVLTAASGSAAIEAAVLATAGRATNARPLALIPAYTFVATAAALEACGYIPYLLDIDPTTWGLDASRLIGHPALSSAGVVVPVAPYGRALDLAAWIDFRAHSGIPVVIDAAAGFEMLLSDPAKRTGDIPVALSFQATKAFSTAEGGAVVWSDFEGIQRVARSLNFGFLYKRESRSAGMNGKMSEYHAAVGLAFLDEWDSRSRDHLELARVYRSIAQTFGVSEKLILAPDVASNYALFDAGTRRLADEITAALQANGIESRLWYGRGLHREPYWSTAQHDALTVTDRIASALIGLPMAADLTHNDMRRIATVLARTILDQKLCQ